GGARFEFVDRLGDAGVPVAVGGLGDVADQPAVGLAQLEAAQGVVLVAGRAAGLAAQVRGGRGVALVGDGDRGGEVGAVPEERGDVQAQAVAGGRGGGRFGLLGAERRRLAGGQFGGGEGALALRGFATAGAAVGGQLVGDLHPAVAGARLLVVLPALLGDRFARALPGDLEAVGRAELLLQQLRDDLGALLGDLKSTRLNSSHVKI